eukprot:13309363-Heterocapsa_arctica.AAC.1
MYIWGEPPTVQKGSLPKGCPTKSLYFWGAPPKVCAVSNPAKPLLWCRRVDGPLLYSDGLLLDSAAKPSPA